MAEYGASRVGQSGIYTDPVGQDWPALVSRDNGFYVDVIAFMGSVPGQPVQGTYLASIGVQDNPFARVAHSWRPAVAR